MMASGWNRCQYRSWLGPIRNRIRGSSRSTRAASADANMCARSEYDRSSASSGANRAGRRSSWRMLKYVSDGANPLLNAGEGAVLQDWREKG